MVVVEVVVGEFEVSVKGSRNAINNAYSRCKTTLCEQCFRVDDLYHVSFSHCSKSLI